jgi:hypothetical protein
MDGLADLFKQIGQIDSTLKLIAFLASILVIIVLALLKRNTDLPKNMMNILLTLFAMVFLLALVAMFIHSEKPLTQPPLTYSLTITLTDSAGNPFSTDQTIVVPNNNLASKPFAPAGSVAWTLVIGAGELATERAVLIFAHTKDSTYSGIKSDTLTYEPNQAVTVILHRTKPNPPGDTPTFSINLSDPALRESIARITGLRYNPASAINKIVVTYDRSSISPDNQKIYSVTASSPIVVIDNRRFTLTGCTVLPPEMNFSHNPHEFDDYVESQSIKVATSYLKRNPKVLAQWLTSLQH